MTLGIRIFIWFSSHYVANSMVSLPPRIPIGGLMDMESPQAKTAFMYQYQKHNNSTAATFKLDGLEKEINVSDPYELKKQMCFIMARGVFSLVGFANTSSLTSIQSYANTFHMPFITPSALTNFSATVTSYSTNTFILHMRPLYDLAIMDIIKSYNWRKVYYIYDTNEGLSRMQHMFHIINTLDIKVEMDVIRIAQPENCYAILRSLDQRDKKGDKYIILDLSTVSAIRSLLKQIQNVGMNRAQYHYLLGGLGMDELELEDFKHGGVNITGFRLLNRTNPRLQAIEREWAKLSRANPIYWKGAGVDERLSLESALTIDALSVFTEGVSNMLKRDKNAFSQIFRRGHVYNGSNGTQGITCNSPAMPWVIGRDIMNALKSVNFEGTTGTVAFDEYGYRRDYTLDIIELGLNTGAQRIGYWNAADGLKISRAASPNPDNKVKPNETRIVTTIIDKPYMFLKEENGEDGEPLVGNDKYDGFCAELAKKVAEIVKFDYIIKVVADGKYGGLEDGRWNGMVGELTNHEADLAIAPLTISSKRERVIDFSKPFMDLGISIMIKKPEKQKPGVFSFMDPLSSQIWMCIVFSYIAVSIVLFLVSRFSPYEWQIEDSVNGPSFTNDFTILNSLWFSLGAFMQQGCDISPRSMSGRIVGSAWWFFTLIIISSYTANLAAFLTVERMLTPIESADDLAKQSEILYGCVDSGSTKDFFKTSQIKVYQTMWDFMSSKSTSTDNSVFVKENKKGVEKVRNSKGKYAFLLESTLNDYYNQKKPCNTMKVGVHLDSKGYGIATPLGSDLRESINLAVLQLRESGELQKLQKKWWYDKGECNAEAESKGSSQSALTLSNVAGIFYILIGGLGLSMIISLLEFLYKSRVEARRQKKYAASFRSKTRLSVRGTPERENGGYPYSAPNQVISLDNYADYACPGNLHTEV